MSLKVLVVEDDFDFQNFVQVYLECKGHRVFIAGNGKDAIELAEKGKPNVILMDLSLPVLDGWAAIRMIHDNPATHDIPIIVVSAYCKEYELKREALAAGAAICLNKPIEPEVLNRAIVSCTHR